MTNTPQPLDRQAIMALWDYHKPAETEQRFREHLDETCTSGDTLVHGILLTQIARTYSLRSMFDDAHAMLDRVEPMLGDGGSVLRVYYLLERGRALNSAGRKSKAEPLFDEAWRVARGAGEDGLSVDAAHMLAIVSEPDAALQWNLTALGLVESSDAPGVKRWLGSLYNNIGWTYFDKGDPERALVYFEKGLAWRREQGQPRETQIAEWSVARACRELGRIDEALAIQMRLKEQVERPGAEPDGYVYEELGECMLLKGDEAAARPHFARAYELLSQDAWLVEQEPERMARLKQLGGVP